MPGLTEEEMAAIALESPWQIGGDEMLGKMISEWVLRELTFLCLDGWDMLRRIRSLMGDMKVFGCGKKLGGRGGVIVPDT